MRAEYEYKIPFNDGFEMIDKFCDARSLIVKTRYHDVFDGTQWVVDQFHGHHRGLYIAEVELPQDVAYVAFPPWLLGEVTHDPPYSNVHLARYGLPKET